MEKLEVGFWLLVALIVPQLCLCVSPPHGHAQDEVQRELALAVSRVCVNEASLSAAAPEDCALIWQAARNRARTDESRLAWLRAHSSCVLTDRPMSEQEAQGNCRYSRYLQDNDTQPEGWPEDLEWGRFTRRWQQIRTVSLRLVTGRLRLEPCDGAVFTWGSAEDHANALAHGLVPLVCRGTLNTGYALADPS